MSETSHGHLPGFSRSSARTDGRTKANGIQGYPCLAGEDTIAMDGHGPIATFRIPFLRIFGCFGALSIIAKMDSTNSQL